MNPIMAAAGYLSTEFAIAKDIAAPASAD